MKKNVMPDSLTKLNFDPSPVLELQNLCVEELCLLYSSEPKYDPYLSLTFKICMKKYVMPDSLTKLNFDPSPVLDPQDLCVEVLYVLEAVEVSDGEHE